MLLNRSMPKATVIPQLGYEDVGAAAEWLGRAFGFTVRLRIADHRIQMNVGDSAVILTRTPNAPKASVMVRVDDADTHHARAIAAGANASPPQTWPYGERQYSAIDCGGHTWVFLQYLLGFRDLGWDVLLVDSLDPALRAEDDRNVRYLTAVMEEFGLADNWSLRVGTRRSASRGPTS